MLVFFLIVGGLLYLASVYIKQKYGTLDIFVEEAKRKLSGDEVEDKEPGVFEDPNVPPVASNLVAPSPEDPDVEAQEEVPEPTQEQLSKWKELEEMCKPGGLRSVYTGFTVDEETGEFVPEYENIDCCYEQPWENEGECVDGQQKQVRGILNEDLCEVEPQKEQMLDCCSYGEWENDGDCIDGVQKQKRQIFNPELCVDTTTTREIDCCSYGEWELDGECVDGNQNYKRTIINSELCEDTSLKKTEPCCLPLEWANDGVCKPTGMQDQIRAHINRDLCVGEAEKDYQEVPCCYRDDWQNDGTCDFSEGKISQKRTIKNADICRAEGDAATSQTVDCCYIGPWVDDGPGDEETGIQKQGRELRNEEMCPTGTKKTQEIPGCKRGPWVPDPNWNYGRGCNADGEIAMVRTITLMNKCRNPDPTSEENRLSKIDKCCIKGEWSPEGECIEGKQKLTRTILNEDLCDENDGDVDGTNTEKIVDCCGVTDWEIDKTAFGADENQNYCKPNGKRTEIRTLYNRNLCDSFILTQPMSREVDCCYISDSTVIPTDEEQIYGVDNMSYLNWWKSEIERDSNAKITVDDWNKYKEENIKPCNADGKVRVKRNVANPELCRAEAAAGTRKEDAYSYQTEYDENCCYIGDIVPLEGSYCKWSLSQSTRTPRASQGTGTIDSGRDIKNRNVCGRDELKMRVKFLWDERNQWNNLLTYNNNNRYNAWQAAKRDGTAFWNGRWYGDQGNKARTCYSSGKLADSDVNWGDYAVPDPNVSTDGKCGDNGDNKRCPGKQCCSRWGWCGGSVGTYDSGHCAEGTTSRDRRNHIGGNASGSYDGVHWYRMPSDTDWSITK